ncbi:hypothetical protein [Glaciecola petra]|uniref:Uncharacterized protein n=1 Tax=Glaciecola petra TaxID=3075602 RepID=A0ABU2ZT00_9ALTE|nr:hypothetical protein [Aestuariibacter sp. P117]MDT0594547.1 hypothetical protein [Aestuariibacter sp. P117]
MKNITFIKNPLTIIAFFAGLSESISIGVLPFLDKELAFYFIWFVMFFPPLIVLLFFYTLYTKHEVLYAPADYQNEDNFTKSYSKADPKEIQNKLQEDAKIALNEEKQTVKVGDVKLPQEQVKSGSDISNIRLRKEAPPPPPLPASLVKETAEKTSEIKNSLIYKIENEKGLSFQTDVVFDDGSKREILDAMTFDMKFVHVMDVKYYRKVPNENEIYAQIDRLIHLNFRKYKKTPFFYFYFVIDEPNIDFDKLNTIATDRIKTVIPSTYGAMSFVQFVHTSSITGSL